MDPDLVPNTHLNMDEQYLQQLRYQEYGLRELVQNAKLQLNMSMRNLRADRERAEAESTARIMRERSMAQESSNGESDRVEIARRESQNMASEPTDREMAELSRSGSEQPERDEGMSELRAKEQGGQEQADPERTTTEQAEVERDECEQSASRQNWQKKTCDVLDAPHMEWAQERHVRDQSVSTRHRLCFN